MKYIRLKSGVLTKIDSADYSYLSQWKWYLSKNGYAYTHGDNAKVLYMHRLVKNIPAGKYADHINRDKLDNRKRNLRVATPKESAANKGLQSNNTSGYKGVGYHKYAKKWTASIVVDYKKINIGYFSEPVEAAKAYNEAAKKHHGKFAQLNQIDS